MDLAEIEKDRMDAALIKVRSQLKVHPDSPMHHFLLAKLLEKEDSAGHGPVRTEAIKSALTAVKLKPSFVGVRDLLANVYLASGQYELARRQSELALKYDPADHPAIYHLITAMRHSSSRADRDQLKTLAKRLAEAQEHQRQKDMIRRSYKLLGDHSTQ